MSDKLREALERIANQKLPPEMDEYHAADADYESGYTIIVELAREALAAEQPIDLQSIEQYRLQMAGIRTAALGYWKEGDEMHPDYDTPALHDVAKLYAKYAALYRAQAEQPKSEPVAWYDGNKFYGSEEAANCGCADMNSLRAVYFAPPAPSIPSGYAQLERARDAYKWGYEYLQDRMRSIGRNGWAQDCDGEIEYRIAAKVQQP